MGKRWGSFWEELSHLMAIAINRRQWRSGARGLARDSRGASFRRLIGAVAQTPHFGQLTEAPRGASTRWRPHLGQMYGTRSDVGTRNHPFYRWVGTHI